MQSWPIVISKYFFEVEEMFSPKNASHLLSGVSVVRAVLVVRVAHVAQPGYVSILANAGSGRSPTLVSAEIFETHELYR